MKLRYGFVSNSSTTSFCIYGTEARSLPHGMDAEEVEEALRKLDPRFGRCGNNDFGLFFGIGWSDINDDETGGQLKAKVQSALKEVFGPEVVCETIQEAWYD